MKTVSIYHSFTCLSWSNLACYGHLEVDNFIKTKHIKCVTVVISAFDKSFSYFSLLNTWWDFASGSPQVSEEYVTQSGQRIVSTIEICHLQPGAFSCWSETLLNSLFSMEEPPTTTEILAVLSAHHVPKWAELFC